MKALYRKNPQSGQTLIETLAAVFVLAMGITAVVGLANFTFNSTSNVTKQVVGVGLARQGIEALKNMRDTNWLRAGNPSTDCYNFKNQENTATCYRNWLSNSNAYTISPGTYTLKYNASQNSDTFPSSSDIKFWSLAAPDPTNGYTLFYYPLTSTTQSFYSPEAVGKDPQLSGYYRSITITEETAPTPYDKDSAYSVVRVVSRVWWNDRKCPVASNFTYPTTGSCRVTFETILSNWKTN